MRLCETGTTCRLPECAHLPGFDAVSDAKGSPRYARHPHQTQGTMSKYTSRHETDNVNRSTKSGQPQARHFTQVDQVTQLAGESGVNFEMDEKGMPPIQNPPRTRNIRPGGHIQLYFALLLVALLQPVFIHGQTPTRTPASDAASLFQAQSIRCEWGQGTMASWNEGRPSLEQGSFGMDAGMVFDSIDTRAGTARIIGNAAAGDISVVVTPVGLTFIEQAEAGGLNFTTVFTHFVEPENVARVAVTSRHLGFSSPFPSQYHGTCVILQ